MLRAEVNNRLFIQQLPREWLWDDGAGVVCVTWSDGESFAFIAGRELTDIVYSIPDLLAIPSLENELEEAGVPIKDIYQSVMKPNWHTIDKCPDEWDEFRDEHKDTYFEDDDFDAEDDCEYEY